MGPAGRLSVAAALLSCLCLHGLLGNSGQAFGQGPPVLHRIDHAEEDDDSGGLMPELSPTGSPQPFVPFLAPAPLAPFYNNSTPKLVESGLYTLEFMKNWNETEVAKELNSACIDKVRANILMDILTIRDNVAALPDFVQLLVRQYEDGVVVKK
ncbi:uncharacterized protein LOC125536937 [Triticum urartu]|uniref:uncharacterized protein LOC125536937 n=1 Tax=Triticum urartu TaxID=4572 RepID=UPI002043CE51|nr:uncharacterized protein LOC125536937 [Triticum urartu]